jgi:hypothetical protein
MAGRLAAAGESVVDVPPKLSARVRVLSIGNTRKGTMGSMPWPPRWPPRATSGWRRSISRSALRCCACFPRGAKTWWPSAPGRSRQPARAPTRPRPRRGGRDALSPQSRTHPARHTSTGRRLGPPPPAVGFGGAALSVRTLDRKIADLNERIEAEVEASGTTLTKIFGVGPILAAKIIGTG